MFKNISYRDQVRNVLLARMKSGKLEAGDKISLAQLSRELNVSVTPIREALTQLQQANIVASIPNRGFVMPVMNETEVKNIYELIACLEGLAIENSKITPEIIQKLKVQQAIFKQTTHMSRTGSCRFEHLHKWREGLFADSNLARSLCC